MKLRKIVVMALVVAMTTLVGCGNGKKEVTEDTNITVISREDGSGTRSAFVELLGIVDKDNKDSSSLPVFSSCVFARSRIVSVFLSLTGL